MLKTLVKSVQKRADSYKTTKPTAIAVATKNTGPSAVQTIKKAVQTRMAAKAAVAKKKGKV